MKIPQWVQRDAVIPVPPRGEGVLVERLDDEAILVNPVSGKIHRLNETAAAVWNLCDGQTTTRQSAEHLTQVYDVGFEEALDYVEQLIAWLAQSDLLEMRADT